MQVITPSTHDIGAFDVRRTLPDKARTMVGPFIFVDQFGPAHFDIGKGMDVRPHPHINLATVTYLFEGAIDHRDSLGTFATIRPGACNLMTAGRGIAHTEDSARDGARAHAAQLWIALPGAASRCAPAFQHCPDLPVQDCGGFRATVLAGSAFGQTAPAVLHTPLVGIDLTARAAAHTQLPLRADFEYAAIVLRGAATLAGEALAPGEWLYFAPGREALDVRCEAEAQWLLLGGVPFEEPLIIWWNLVARTQAEIESALADWNAGRFTPVRAGSSAQPLAAPSLAGVQLRGG